MELFSPTPERQPPPWILWVGCYFKYCFHQLFYRQLHLSSYLIYYCKGSLRSLNPLKILRCFIICNDLLPPPFSASGRVIIEDSVEEILLGGGTREYFLIGTETTHVSFCTVWDCHRECCHLWSCTEQFWGPHVRALWTLGTEPAALCQSNTNTLPWPELQRECHLLPQMPMADTQLSTRRDSQLLSDSMPCFISFIMLYILKHWNQKVTVLLIFT